MAFHRASSEFSAVLVLLAMMSFALLYVLPSLNSWLECGVFGVSWIIAQRMVAAGGKYTRPKHTDDEGGDKQKEAGIGPLDGKIAIITGANSGIGFETAKELASLGVTVYLGCRRESEAKRTIAAITLAHPNAKVHFLQPLDLSDLASVKRFVDRFKALNCPLHLLANNAGLIVRQFSTVECNGVPYETHIITNYLGPLLLTELLMPILIGTKGSRIVNVASAAHNRVKLGLATKSKSGESRPRPLNLLNWLCRRGTTTFGDSAATTFKSLGGMQVYGLSKLCNIYMTHEHSKQLRNRCGPDCISVALHPGVVATNIFNSFVGSNPVMQFIGRTLPLVICKTPREGAQTTLHACTTKDVVANAYYIDCKDYGRGTGVSALSEAAVDEAASKACYEWGLNQIKSFMT